MRTITNKNFVKALKDNNLGDVILVKDNGYFWITSDNYDYSMSHNLDRARSIYVNSFNHMTIKEWIDEIKSIIADCERH